MTNITDYLREFLIKREIKKSSEAAAKWWADRLRGKNTYRSGSFLIDATVTYEASRLKPLEPAKINVFEKELVGIIQKEYSEDQAYRRKCARQGTRFDVPVTVNLEVDYNPDGYLREAARKSDIADGDFDCLRLPTKTMMWINKKEVRVRMGYHAEEKVIYKK